MMDAIASNAAAAAPNPLPVFDARGLQPPENILAVLRKAAALPAGSSLRIRTDCYPFQLYDLLQQRGFFLAMTRDENGAWSGIITPRDVQGGKH